MRKSTLPILAICAALLLVGAGCLGDEDVSLIVGFVKDWAQSHEVLDANGNPTAKTIGYVASGGYVSTGDNTADALIDAGQATKGVQDADTKLDDADAAMADGTANGRAKALQLSDEALKGRPDDQEVRTRRGIILSEAGQEGEGKKYLATYADGCDTAKNPSMSDAQKRQCLHNISDEGDRLRAANAGKSYEQHSCAMLKEEEDAYTRAADLARAVGDQNAVLDLNEKEYQAARIQCTHYTPPPDDEL